MLAGNRKLLAAMFPVSQHAHMWTTPLTSVRITGNTCGETTSSSQHGCCEKDLRVSLSNQAALWQSEGQHDYHQQAASCIFIRLWSLHMRLQQHAVHLWVTHTTDCSCWLSPYVTLTSNQGHCPLERVVCFARCWVICTQLHTEKQGVCKELPKDELQRSMRGTFSPRSLVIF